MQVYLKQYFELFSIFDDIDTGYGDEWGWGCLILRLDDASWGP